MTVDHDWPSGPTITRIWVQGSKCVLSLLILTLLIALAGGTAMTFPGLQRLSTDPLEVVLRQVIVNTLVLLVKDA